MVIPWKLANEIGDPSHSVLILLGVAAIGNTALIGAQQVSQGTFRLQIDPTAIGVAALLAAFTLLGNVATSYAIQDLTPALLNVLLRADVTIVAIFAWLFLNERVEGRFWLGAAIAVGGLIVLQGPLGDSGIADVLSGGTGLALAGAACFSSLAIITRRFIHQIAPVTVNALRLWFAVAFWFAFNPLPRLSEIPPQQVFYAGIAAIAGPFLGRLALMNSARYVEARVTTLATLTTPAMTLIPAYIVLSEWPKNYELIGGAIMIAGISIPLFRRNRVKHPNS